MMPDMAPGCFGSALAYEPDLEECRTCGFSTACGSAAAECAASIRAKLLGDALEAWRSERPKPGGSKIVVGAEPSATAKPKKPTEPKPAPVEGEKPALPKKSAELIGRVERAGIDVKGELSAGRNPFEGKTPAYMRIVCAMLLAGGFTRKELKQAFLDRLGWREGAAASHVAIACGALPVWTRVIERDGRFQLEW